MAVFIMLYAGAIAQTGLQQGAWFGNLIREDGKVIRFHFDIKTENNKTVLYLINAADRFRVDQIRYTKDSVFIEMPVFESGFKAKRISAQYWRAPGQEPLQRERR
jgi:hypothetical protein